MLIERDSIGQIPLIPGRNYVVTIAGDFDGEVVALDLITANEFVPMPSPYTTISVPTAFEFTAPCELLEVITAPGAGPAMEVFCTLCKS